MVDSADDNGDSKTNLKPDTRALADINYNNIIAADNGTSSEDDAPETQVDPAEDARTTLGVSISRQQTRLTSPQTPAIEKEAAIERAGGFFGNDVTLIEEPEEEDEEGANEEYRKKATTPTTPQVAEGSTAQIPEHGSRKPPARLPSPWQSSAQWQQSGKTKPGLLDGLWSSRKRSSTGPDSTLEGWQKSLVSSLPSLPKRLSLASPFSSSSEAPKSSENASKTSSKRSSAYLASPTLAGDLGEPTTLGRQRAESDGTRLFSGPTPSQEMHQDREGVEPLESTSPRYVQARAALLRRSTSDQSLTTQRTLSLAPSLGDDSRFENVQDQVNSRMKAIRDSWQDSTIKLPSLSNFKPDFLRERAESRNRKWSTKPAAIGNDDFGTTHLRDSGGLEYNRPKVNAEPFSFTKTTASQAMPAKPLTTSNFHRALEQLEGDIVILGGYRGSILRSADPPHRQLWVPVKVGLNLRKADLEVGIEEGDDERASEKIIPSGMLTNIGPVDIARRLFKRLRHCKNARNGKLRVHDYGYDWRLDPLYLSKQLLSFLESLPCNKPDVDKEQCGATVIAHSLGGLITRHAVNKRPHLFRGVVYAGVPTTCVNILGPMRNGDEVLLSNRVLTAQVNFTFRTSFALLPLDGRCFFDKITREEYPVDFFDPQTWIDLKLSPCVGRPLPPLNPPAKPTGITSYVNSMANALPSLPLPGRKSSLKSKDPADSQAAALPAGVGEPDMAISHADASDSVGTTVTMPREKAIEYLTRTLASVKQFKEELNFLQKHATADIYPPAAVIYGKSTPTVYGAKVDGKEGIKRADAYDELAFASGDGVVLARAAMLPAGYSTARGGIVSSERGHVTLLSDLEAVGKCLNAINVSRKNGTGLGKSISHD